MINKVVTFYNDLVNLNISKNQKKIFDFFEIELIHYTAPFEIKDTRLFHPVSIDNFLRNEEYDNVLLIDVDCIPLDRYIIGDTFRWVEKNDGIFSYWQYANHIPNSKNYCGVGYMCFSHALYEKLGEPSFVHDDLKYDVGGLMTIKANEMDVDIYCLPVTSCVIPRWHLEDKKTFFGIGTTYGYRIYHLYESRIGRERMFIDKCNEVIQLNA